MSNNHEIRQDVVDQVFFIKAGHCGDYTSREILLEIRETLKDQLNIEISNTESHIFWKWRCKQWDSSFLRIMNKEEAIEWFHKYCHYTLDGDFDTSPYGEYDE